MAAFIWHPGSVSVTHVELQRLYTALNWIQMSVHAAKCCVWALKTTCKPIADWNIDHFCELAQWKHHPHLFLWWQTWLISVKTWKWVVNRCEFKNKKQKQPLSSHHHLVSKDARKIEVFVQWDCWTRGTRQRLLCKTIYSYKHLWHFLLAVIQQKQLPQQ